MLDLLNSIAAALAAHNATPNVLETYALYEGYFRYVGGPDQMAQGVLEYFRYDFTTGEWVQVPEPEAYPYFIVICEQTTRQARQKEAAIPQQTVRIIHAIQESTSRSEVLVAQEQAMQRIEQLMFALDADGIGLRWRLLNDRILQYRPFRGVPIGGGSAAGAETLATLSPLQMKYRNA